LQEINTRNSSQDKEDLKKKSRLVKSIKKVENGQSIYLYQRNNGSIFYFLRTANYYWEWRNGRNSSRSRTKRSRQD
jgi:hypothetical protein